MSLNIRDVTRVSGRGDGGAPSPSFSELGVMNEDDTLHGITATNG